MSRSLTLERTVAPASLQIHASVLSGATARVRNRPECGQAALWRPLVSIDEGATLADSVCHGKWQPQPFQDQSAEEFWLNCELWSCGASMQRVGRSTTRVGSQVGLVTGTMTGATQCSP